MIYRMGSIPITMSEC